MSSPKALAPAPPVLLTAKVPPMLLTLPRYLCQLKFGEGIGRHAHATFKTMNARSLGNTLVSQVAGQPPRMGGAQCYRRGACAIRAAA
jgi:hypothetical protein